MTWTNKIELKRRIVTGSNNPVWIDIIITAEKYAYDATLTALQKAFLRGDCMHLNKKLRVSPTANMNIIIPKMPKSR